jgi:hypothetical protein
MTDLATPLLDFEVIMAVDIKIIVFWDVIPGTR